MNKTKFTFFDHIGVVIFLYLILSAVFPMITLYGKNIAFCLAFEMLWFAVASYDMHRKFMGIFRKWIWWLAFLFYLFAVPLMFDNDIIANRYSPYYIAVFGVMMFEYYYNNKKMYVIGRAIKISAPFYLFTLVKTIYAAMANPWVVRTIQSSQVDTHIQTQQSFRQGIGDYGFIYLCVIFFALAAIYFFFSKKFKTRVIAAIIMALSFILCIVANYTTAMIACVVVAIATVFCYIAHSLRTNEGARIFEVFMFVILLMVAVLGRGVITSFISGFIQEGSRIGSLTDSGDGSFFQAVYEEFTVDRWPRMKKNIDLLLEHLFFGQVPLGVGITEDLGQHSSILDTFSLWGFVVGVLFVKMIGLPYKRYDIYRKNSMYRKPLYTALFMVAFFNNLTHGILLASTVICPYFIYKLCEKEGKQNDDRVDSASYEENVQTFNKEV